MPFTGHTPQFDSNAAIQTIIQVHTDGNEQMVFYERCSRHVMQFPWMVMMKSRHVLELAWMMKSGSEERLCANLMCAGRHSSDLTSLAAEYDLISLCVEGNCTHSTTQQVLSMHLPGPPAADAQVPHALPMESRKGLSFSPC